MTLIERVERELRERLPDGFSYAQCSDFCGDANCGIRLRFEQCADEVQVWGDNEWRPDILRALGESLIAAAGGDDGE